MANDSIGAISVQIRADSTKLKSDMDQAASVMSSEAQALQGKPFQGIAGWGSFNKAANPRDRAIQSVAAGFSSQHQSLEELRASMRPDMIRKQVKLNEDIRKAQAHKDHLMAKELETQQGGGGFMGSLMALAGPIGMVAGGIAAGAATIKMAFDTIRGWVALRNPMAAERWERVTEDLQATLGEVFLPVIEEATVGLRAFADMLALIVKSDQNGTMKTIVKEGFHAWTLGVFRMAGMAAAALGADGASEGMAMKPNWRFTSNAEDVSRTAWVAALNATGGGQTAAERTAEATETLVRIHNEWRARVHRERADQHGGNRSVGFPQ